MTAEAEEQFEPPAMEDCCRAVKGIWRLECRADEAPEIWGRVFGAPVPDFTSLQEASSVLPPEHLLK